MSTILPLILEGDNLGKRHRYINFVVKKAEENHDFEKIKDLPELSPIDRIFKIDLASKLRNVDYLLENLKCEDMLYVSKALKSKWILETEYKNIMNPILLENNLYPNMITPAVTKMKQWLYLNLTDEDRNKIFYEYYSEKQFDYAIKFLFNCSNIYIEDNFPKIIHKINPKHFKIFCEKSSIVVKMFFDEISKNESVKQMYLNNEKQYFNSLKLILKSDPNLCLDIYEKYFKSSEFSKFSPQSTKYIMLNCKQRFLLKPELYTAWFLDVKTLANFLTPEECKELIEKLARAIYLHYFFDYKAVEPLVKRIEPEERAAFKKKIFVDHDFGTKVEKWPYEVPSSPDIEGEGINIFEDSEHSPCEYENLDRTNVFGKRMIKKRCMNWSKMEDYCYETEMFKCAKSKTMLDKLFDEFRFCSFDKTLYELRQRIKVESSSQNREYMMLVLVSKTGGRFDAMETLLELLAQHSNEPANIRATVIRSLVKRAFVWRLPEDTWLKFIKFGRGLGLDGKTPEADCVEGLHCVVIRNLLKGNVDAEVSKAYLENFSDFSKYTLNSAEKACIKEKLPKMLFDEAKEADTSSKSLDLIDKLIDTLESYKINVSNYPGLIELVIYWAGKDYEHFMSLLLRLYNSNIARKQLFRLTFDLITTDSSYINALKHDPTIIDVKKLINLYTDEKLFTEQFLRKLSVYYSGDNGLANQVLKEIKAAEPNNIYGRSLAVLLSIELDSYLETLKDSKHKNAMLLASAIKSNAHLIRPAIDISSIEWKKFGAKFVANKTIICRQTDVDLNIQKLLKWKPTMKIAFVLSKRVNKEIEVLEILAKNKPTVAIKIGMKLIKKHSDYEKIWKIIKLLIEDLDFNNKKLKYVIKVIRKVNSVPVNIQPALSTLLYKKYKTVSYYSAMPFLCYIENLLPQIDENFIHEILTEFLENFVSEKLIDKFAENNCTSLYLRILLKYLYLCKSKDEQNRKLNNIGAKFFNKMELIHKSSEKKKLFFEFIDDIIFSLKYTKVFINPEYVCCLPVMEKVVLLMQNILPMEKYFDKFIKIHLTMLYFKALRHTVLTTPETFDNKKIMIEKGTKLVGYNFGRFIAKEVKVLIDKYFESVIVIYLKTLIDYLENYFCYTDSPDFFCTIVKGILENSKGIEIVIGIYVLKEKCSYMKQSAEIKKYLENKNDINTKLFAYAELFANM